jgi:hypothetical protein
MTLLFVFMENCLPLLLAAMKFGWCEVVPIRAGFTGKANKLGWAVLKP